MLDKILQQLNATGETIELDGATWEQSGFRVAGAQRLSHHDQLQWWARHHGVECIYDPSRRCYRLRMVRAEIANPDR